MIEKYIVFSIYSIYIHDHVIFIFQLFLYFLVTDIGTTQILVFHFPLRHVIIGDMLIFDHVESMPCLASTR